MPADAQPKLPPVRVAAAVETVRRGLRRFERKLQPPAVSVLDIMQGAWVAQAVYAAVKLDIIEALGDAPQTAQAVAARVDANPDAVHRLLRTLASRGIVAQNRGGRYALAPLGDSLRADAPDSLRGIVLFWGDPVHWEHWGQLSGSVRTGESAVEELRGKPTFDWLPDEPEFAAVFNNAMTSISKMETPMVVGAYDFSGYGTIVDVGGGHGLLLSAILNACPQARGILFDAETVVAGAPEVLAAAGVADRCTTVGGSFFESVPSGGDAYVLKHIVHDWGDDDAVQILRTVRAAMTSDAKVLIMEAVVPDDDREHISKLLDLEMLVASTGGKERTEAEYVELLRRAGFRHTRSVPTVGPGSIIEGQPA